MSKLFKILVIFLLTQNQHQILSTTLDQTEDSSDYPVYKNDDEFIMVMSGGYRPIKQVYNKYMVSIRTARTTAYFGDNHFCSGTIISARLIVTAAHCIKDSNRIVTRPKRLRVVAGTPDRLQKIDSTQELDVEQVLPHEKYIRRGANDVALLRLKTSIPDYPYSEYINIIPLRKTATRPGDNCTALGWGQLFYRGPYAATPVYIDLEILTTSECRKFYPTFAEGMICGMNKKEDDARACGGDSGGPLICDSKLAGIVAWGARCEKSTKATVFTDLYYHLAWIESNDGQRLSAFSGCMVILGVIWFKHLFYC